jgi:hypothetical protein
VVVLAAVVVLLTQMELHQAAQVLQTKGLLAAQDLETVVLLLQKRLVAVAVLVRQEETLTHLREVPVV